MREYGVRVTMKEVREVTYDVYIEGEITNEQAKKLVEKHMLGVEPVLKIRGKVIEPESIHVVELSQEKVTAPKVESIKAHLLAHKENLEGT